MNESLRVQDQTEPLVEPALMWSPRETLERKNGPCIRRNFGAAQEQACKTCCCGAEWGHRRWQHANTTEFFGSDSRNLLNLMLAATVYIKVPVESACIMLSGFRVRILVTQGAFLRVAPSPSAPAAHCCHRRPHLLRSLPHGNGADKRAGAVAVQVCNVTTGICV